MRYLPLHLDLKGRELLVVGGGEVARRKVELLLKADARITLIARKVDQKLHELAAGQHLNVVVGDYHSEQLDGKLMVVAATSDSELNRRISEDAKARNMLVNVVDAPELCTVTFPAIIDRGHLVVSVGSSGTSPVLTRHIREMIEQFLPERLSRLATFLADKREALKKILPDTNRRRRHLESFLGSSGAEAAMAGKLDVAEAELLRPDESPVTGEVYLVGAGPGDPDLLTLRALQLMQKADVVLYDNLVSSRILDRVRRDAVLEFVGKRSGYKSTSQEDINTLLVRLAGEGKRVLRLKGGDPFIFGRGGEEIQQLIEQGIPCQIVPGITAASGCAAYAGIPLTHRELAQSVRFVTGHPSEGKVNLPWKELVHPLETLVFYMGLGGLATICQQLISAGRDAGTPVAIVSKGTTPDQQVLKGTLLTMPGLVARTQIQTPTLVIVGEVVNFPASHNSEASANQQLSQ